MADSDTEITKEELQKEIAAILDNASLDNTSTKKVIQKLEQKLGVDLTEKKKLIDQLVMDYVNSMDSEEEDLEAESEEEPPKKKPAVRKAKKHDDDEDDDEHDDSNDSDWGYHHHHHHDGHLLYGYSEDSNQTLPQEPTVTTSGIRHLPNGSRSAVILKRVDEDEADIFGKLTAKKLRKLSAEQRDLMMIQINQLFYDKCHKRTPPKRKMVDKSTGMLPVIECTATAIYRIDGPPVNLTTPITPITRARFPNPFGTMTNGPKTVVPPSNVPEPVVQEAATPKPLMQAQVNCGKCGLM